MKTDDDILINPLMFNQFIANITNSKNTIYGILGKGFKPHRSKTSKWYVSHESYSPSIYPDFMFGSYIMSSDSIHPIYKEVLNSLPALAFEDVYISGIIAEKCNISRVNINYFVRLDSLHLKSSEIDFEIFNSYILFSHDFGYNLIITIWDKFNLTLNKI
jgi:hypothetical protein